MRHIRLNLPCVQHVRDTIARSQVLHNKRRADIDQCIVAKVMCPRQNLCNIVFIDIGDMRVRIVNDILHNRRSDVSDTNFTSGTTI